jgi:hypothetical protein
MSRGSQRTTRSKNFKEMVFKVRGSQLQRLARKGEIVTAEAYLP